jgi:alpha-N-arabinofuranosidase
LEELEFLMGDTSTKWGAKRAALGYPDPWPIRYVEVGNEDSLSDGAKTYRAYRFQMFYDAISEKYPDMTIIVSGCRRELRVHVLTSLLQASFYDVDGDTPPYQAAGDFHEYAVPLQMSSQFGYFDNYTNEHPLLLGEYAIVDYDIPGFSAPMWEPGAPRAFYPFWYGSVSEAIYLLSAERNSDNRWQWVPDNIAFDANPAHTILSTSYQVIKLLGSARITENLPSTGGNYNPAYWVAGRSDKTGSHIAKTVVYNATADTHFAITFDDVSKGEATLSWMTAPKNASSTIGHDVIKYTTSTVTANKKGAFHFDLPPYSVAVLEVDAASSGYGSPSSRKGWLGWDDWVPNKAINSKVLNQWGQGWPAV